MKTLQEIKAYLDQEYRVYKLNPDIARDEVRTDVDPAKYAFGDALVMIENSQTPEQFVEKVRRNQARMSGWTIAYPEKAYRDKACAYYQMIVDFAEEDEQ